MMASNTAKVGTAPVRDKNRWYRKVPPALASVALPAEFPRWRIELHGLGPTAEPLGMEVLGDTILGRGRGGMDNSDVDLDEYGGLEKGISRRHALLRPTIAHLYLIDLGSTNGTLHNGSAVRPGFVSIIKHKDSITLGRLSFTVMVVSAPLTDIPAPEGAASAHPPEQFGVDGTKPLDDSHPSRTPTEAGTQKAVTEEDIKRHLAEREAPKAGNGKKEG